MKITVSYDDVVALLRRQYNLPTDATITISRKGKSNIINKRTTRTGHVIPSFLNDKTTSTGENAFAVIADNVSNNKITAIRELRYLSGYGLKESKDCVENWNGFYKYLLDNDCFPRVNYSFGQVVFGY